MISRADVGDIKHFKTEPNANYSPTEHRNKAIGANMPDMIPIPISINAFKIESFNIIKV